MPIKTVTAVHENACKTAVKTGVLLISALDEAFKAVDRNDSKTAAMAMAKAGTLRSIFIQQAVECLAEETA